MADTLAKQLCDGPQVASGSTTATIEPYKINNASSASNLIEEKPLRCILIWLFDAGAIAVTTLGASLIYSPTVFNRQHEIAAAAFVCVATFCLIHRGSRNAGATTVSSYRERLRRFLPLASTLLVAAVAGDLVLAFFGSAWLPLLAAMSIWLASCLFAIVTARYVGSYASTHPSVSRRMARNVAVIGDGAPASEVANICINLKGSATRLVGIFNDNPRSPIAAATGSVDDLVALSRQMSIDDVIIALPPGAEALATITQLRWRLRGVAVAVYVLPDQVRAAEVALPVTMFGPLALNLVQCRPLTFQQEFFKRLFDVAIALILIAILAPLCAVVALAVKLDSPGPVLFRQPRIGRNDRPFTVLKFRSMHADLSDTMATRQTVRFDPRVTSVGRWLRKLSLDELPQLLNVIAGDMSLVGPRPHAPHTRADGRLLRDAMAEYVLRQQVKPGITGWAQVNGSRGAIVTLEDLYRRVTYDLEYIQRWSIGFDIRIISMTVFREVISKRAF